MDRNLELRLSRGTVSRSGNGSWQICFSVCDRSLNGSVDGGAGDGEQQSPDRVGRIVHGSADAEFDALDGELVDDIFRIPQGASQSVELGNHQGVAVPARGQGFSQVLVVLGWCR